ncbi:hypothetical protein COM95_28710 [Bacillus cereus]|nr:hypothetical protein COM95_28710 [Bacillus cereus]
MKYIKVVFHIVSISNKKEFSPCPKYNKVPMKLGEDDCDIAFYKKECYSKNKIMRGLMDE